MLFACQVQRVCQIVADIKLHERCRRHDYGAEQNRIETGDGIAILTASAIVSDLSFRFPWSGSGVALVAPPDPLTLSPFPVALQDDLRILHLNNYSAILARFGQNVGLDEMPIINSTGVH